MLWRVRLKRGVLVSGVDPAVARALARACHREEFCTTARAASVARVPPADAGALLTGLAVAGFLEHQIKEWGGGRHDVWSTTVRGGALAGASFLKPMTRQRAQSLLEGALDRVRDYNADPGRPMWIEQITVFGSYLDPDAVDFGDLDLQVELANRPAEDLVRVKEQYAAASGRTFSSYIDELYWADREALQVVKNRSGLINVHLEDITRFTDRWRVVYRRSGALA